MDVLIIIGSYTRIKPDKLIIECNRRAQLAWGYLSLYRSTVFVLTSFYHRPNFRLSFIVDTGFTNQFKRMTSNVKLLAYDDFISKVSEFQVNLISSSFFVLDDAYSKIIAINGWFGTIIFFIMIDFCHSAQSLVHIFFSSLMVEQNFSTCFFLNKQLGCDY